MKSGKLLLATAMVALAATGSQAQTYKSNFATKIVLAGGGVDPIHTVTFTTAAPGTSAITLTFPTSLPTPAGTYVLATDNTGALSWINPATGISLAGDVTGTAGATVVSAINGASLGSTTPTAGNILIGSGSVWVTKALGGDATLGSDGTLTLKNSSAARSDLGLGSIATQDASNVSISGGSITGTSISGSTGSFTTLTSAGTTNLNTTTNSAVNIGTGSGNTNAITIGNNAGPSVTDINGTVNFGGTVSFPAGSVTSGSLGLANNDVLIGNGSGNADSAHVAQDVTFENAGGHVVTATVNGSHATTFAATGAITAGGNISTSTGTVSGNTGTFTNLSGTTMTGNIAMGGNNITGGGSFSGTAITGTGNAQIGTGASTTNQFGTGNSDGNTIGVGGVNPSTTTINGNLDITGSVTLPAGSVTTSSLGLANNDVLIGNGSGNADSAHVTQDVTFENAGGHAVTATVNGSNATTFAVAHNETVGGTLGVTGKTTLGTIVISNGGTIAVNADAADIVPGTASSYYFVSNTDASNSHTIGGITLATPAVGTMVQLINTGTNPIVLLNQSTGAANTQFSIAGGNAIMAAGGSATFIYDGTYWHLTASE